MVQKFWNLLRLNFLEPHFVVINLEFFFFLLGYLKISLENGKMYDLQHVTKKYKQNVIPYLTLFKLNVTVFASLL